MTVHTKFVTVTIGEMLDNDEKAFLDIIAGRAFGTAGAQEIDFRAAGFPHRRAAARHHRRRAGDGPVDGTGYPAGHVIGRRGTAVTVLAIDADFVEVDGFSDDSYATGFVPLDALLLTRTT